MTRLRALLRGAQRRLYLCRSIRGGSWFLLAASAAFVLLAVADKLFSLGLPVYPLLLAGVLSSMALGVLWGRRRAVESLAVAMALDARLDAEERLSTALALEGVEGEFAEAVRLEALAALPGIRTGKAFPLRVPAACWWAVGLVAAGALCGEFVGRLDLLGRQQARRQLEEERREVNAQAVALERRLRRLVDESGEKDFDGSVRLVKEFHAISRKLSAEPQTRREALVKLSGMSEALRREEERAVDLGRLAWNARAWRQFSEAEAVSKALAQEDFREAAKAAEELARRAAAGDEGKMTAEKVKKLGEELAQLSKLAQGSSPELAASLRDAAERLQGGDAQAAAKALSKAADQLKMMQQMAHSGPMVRQARQHLNQAKLSIGQGGSLPESCAKCGMPLDEFGNCPMCSGPYGEAGRGQAPASEAGSTGAGMAGEAAAGSEAASGQGLAALGGDRLAGEGGQRGEAGGAFGGPGRGRGGTAPMGSGEGVRWSDVKVPGALHPGEILASVKVKGVPKAGEAAAKYAEVYAAFKRQAEESLGRDPIPLGYRQYVKDYFDELAPAGEQGHRGPGRKPGVP